MEERLQRLLIWKFLNECWTCGLWVYITVLLFFFFFLRIRWGSARYFNLRRTAVIYWPIFYFALKVKIVSLARLVEYVMYFFFFFFLGFRKIFETILLSWNVFNSFSPFNGLEFKFGKSMEHFTIVKKDFFKFLKGNLLFYLNWTAISFVNITKLDDPG